MRILPSSWGRRFLDPIFNLYVASAVGWLLLGLLTALYRHVPTVAAWMQQLILRYQGGPGVELLSWMRIAATFSSPPLSVLFQYLSYRGDVRRATLKGEQAHSGT